MRIKLKKMVLIMTGGVLVFQLMGCEVDEHGHHHWWWRHDHPEAVIVR